MKKIIFLLLLLINVCCTKNDIYPSIIGNWHAESLSIQGSNQDGISLGDISFTDTTFTFESKNYSYTKIGNTIAAQGFTNFTYSIINNKLTLSIAFVRTSQGGSIYTLTYSKN